MATYHIVVKPNGTRNTHHLKLRKGADEVGIILCDAQGRKDPKGMQRQSYPRSALKTYSGEEDYADTEPPFRPISQQDWSGGRGQLVYEKDTRRFYDSWRADTRHAGKIFLGGQETYSTGDHRVLNQNMPGNVSWQSLTGANRYMATKFTTPAGGYTAQRVEVYLRRVGNPGTLMVATFNDGGADPGTIEGFYNVTTTEIPDIVSLLYSDVQIGLPLLAGATAYWVYVSVAATDTVDDHWEIGYSAGVGASRISSNGAVWANGPGSLYYRVLDDTADLHGRKFEYKRAVYLVTQPPTGNSKLYINGSRGAADDNAANKDRLKDATKAAAADWHCKIGDKVVITRGPGSEEAQPWREVASVNIGYLEVTEDWNVTHTTETEYVVLGSDDWDYLADLGGYVTDLAVTDEFIYFARGETAGLGVLRYQEYNNAGVWTPRTAAEIVYAQFLVTTQHPTLGAILWGGRNAHPFYRVCLWKGNVPHAWGSLYTSLDDIVPTDEPWDDWGIASVTQATYYGSTSITSAGGFTGIAAVKNLPQGKDLTRGRYLGFLSYSSVATLAGDLQLVLDDTDNLGKTYSPVALKHYDGSAYTSLDKAKDGDVDTEISRSIQTDDFLYVGFTVPINKISVNLGTTVNLVASVLTGQYFNGSAWAAIAITDGTIVGGTKTLGQDGDITWTTPFDWEKNVVDSLELYWIRFKVSVNLTASVDFKEITVERKNNTTLNFPVHAAATWQWTTLQIAPLQYPLPDLTQAKSFALKIAVDNGAQEVRFERGIRLLREEPIYIDLPNDARVLGLEAYGGGETDRKRNPWVITEKEFGEIQTDELTGESLYVPVVLDELAGLRSENNGKAHAVGGKYLWFNLGERIERYFNELLEDIGPTLDEGLPADRRGTPIRMRSYPGEMFLALDGGASKVSSILSHTNGGWHEVYRPDRAGARIYDILVQTIPGAVDRMWINQGADILWIPVDVNPLSETTYRYTQESVVQSSRVHGGMQDVLKFWKSIKLVSSGLGANGCQVWGDYRLEGSTAWTTLPQVFNESIFQEINLTNDYSASGRYIEIRVRIQTGNAAYTPVINGWVIESLMRFEVKFVWSLNFRLANADKDLLGQQDPMSYTVKRTILDGWLASPTPLLVDAFREDINGAVAYLDPVPLRPLRTVIDPEDKDGSRLMDICQMTLITI